MGRPFRIVFPAIQQAAPLVMLLLLVVLAYLPAMRGGFIWDDDAHLTENPCITGSLGFCSIWSSSSAVYYPLVLTSFWLLHWLFGLDPLPYHAFTIVMHAACSAALWRVLRRLGVKGPWLGAALWALHPVQVESVAWITELKNTQSCLFFLMAIDCFFMQRETADVSTPKGKRREIFFGALSLAFFGMAITSKSSTVMLPCVLALCSWWKEGRWNWKNSVRLIPYFLLSAMAAGWTIWEQKCHSGASGPEWVQPLRERLAISGLDVWFYLGKLAWPHPLIFIYPRWEVISSHFSSYLPVTTAVLLLCVFWWKINGWGRALFFAYSYFLLSLVPVMDFFDVYFFRYSFVGDHFQYLASIGPLALAGAAISSASKRLPIGAAALAVLTLLTWHQQLPYQSSAALWTDTLAKNPNCWMAHNNLGSILEKEGRLDEALQQFLTSLRIKPSMAGHHNNVGNIFLQQNRTEEAIREFREALRIDPNLIDTLNNLGNTLLAQNKVDEALDCYSKAVSLNPRVVDSLNNFGVALVAGGHFPEAMKQYQAALEISARDARVRNNFGLLLFKEQRIQEALVQYQMALDEKPDYTSAWFNMGNALEAVNQMPEAEMAYRKTVELQPNDPSPHQKLGAILRANGKIRNGLMEYRRALTLSPNQIEVINDLAWILATDPDPALRDGTEAVQLALRCNQLTDYKNAFCLDTLAAAYAENGQFSEAENTASQCILRSGDPAFIEQVQARSAKYAARKPHRTSPRDP